MTELLQPNAAGITRAADLLAQGTLVSFPTETVYGLGADARNGQAVAQIYAAKGRPSFNPLIVHVDSFEAALLYGVWSDAAKHLAQAFWPGALTLVVPLHPDAGLSDLVTAGLGTVALRVPDSALARDLLNASNGPIAAPSANPSGKISPTTAAHVLVGLDGKIAAILDGGACTVGVESTIIGCSDSPTLLRAGGIPREAIEAALGYELVGHEGAIAAPGQMASHYAPGASLRLNATAFEHGELRLGFGNVECDLNLSPSGDLIDAAANLFGHLHLLDAMQGNLIAVSPIPETGLGAAINDRLRRAAAPR